uniref:LysR family transcriptional regulator n=1 Tax=Paenirhodobacter enshiensis TaxID=1105367 RepID=UPI0035B31D0C
MTDPKDHLTRSGVTLRELEVLRALVERGTTIAAAERLGLSQPAISRSLGQLEARLAQPLFNRQGGRLVPTAEARRIDAELDTLFETLARIEDPDETLAQSARPLRIAAPPTIAHRFLPGVVAGFTRRHPGQHLIVDVNSGDILVSYVADRRCDLAIVDTEPSHAGVKAETLHAADMVCAIPCDHPLAARSEITPADLDGVPFIAQTRRHSARAAQDSVLFAAGLHPSSVLEVDTAVLTIELVRQGVGVALVNPFPIALHPEPRLCLRPFRPRIAQCTWFLTPAATRPTTALLAFMQMVREAAAGETPPAAPPPPGRAD